MIPKSFNKSTCYFCGNKNVYLYRDYKIHMTFTWKEVSILSRYGKNVPIQIRSTLLGIKLGLSKSCYHKLCYSATYYCNRCSKKLGPSIFIHI